MNKMHEKHKRSSITRAPEVTVVCFTGAERPVRRKQPSFNAGHTNKCGTLPPGLKKKGVRVPRNVHM